MLNKKGLTPEEQNKYEIIYSCIGGDITNQVASLRLGLSIRQIQKLKRRVEKQGELGVVHKLKGRAPINITSHKTKSKILKYFDNKKHKDFGPTFAKEKLEIEGVFVNKETLRTLLIKNNLWKSKARRLPKINREWRERKECPGELVQFDGSYHDWFENGEEHCLLAAIDDATGKILKASFDINEGIPAVFRFWKEYIEQYGRPRAIYLDKFSTYKINHKNAVDNKEFMTQFERVMLDLDIKVICAHSPEAKGRVERLFQTLQDRLIKEMRLFDIKTQEEGDAFLVEKYIKEHNQKFSVFAKNPIDLHRPLTDIQKKNIASIFSVQSKRKVNNDYTIQFKTFWYQLEQTQNTTVYKRDEVVIEEWLNGELHIKRKGIELKYRVLPERPKRIKVLVTALTREKPKWKPPTNHPWRRNF